MTEARGLKIMHCFALSIIALLTHSYFTGVKRNIFVFSCPVGR